MAEEVTNTARTATIKRDTKETQIELTINLDGVGESSIDTGVPFFDHMLDLFARHGLFDLQVKATGDIEIDYHHTVEDVGIVLGEAIKQAVGDKRGMKRYGFFILPMDECLAQVAIDLSNRPIFRYKVEASNVMIRDFNIALVKEFFQAFTNAVGANLHMKLEYGEEPHHIAESLFKCFARAIDVATQIDPRLGDRLPSTKEAL
ncbi:imidazoleglycerol-phosphate dehydratase HisB [Cerasicoccus maritimus]|uniref:imidazoleglycerol-phosphate dehydratase HisB n=1 Tax=Cerasicoccus maritimus TaxID=490089 RepID=UPI0028525968|nr:imidazoleglycerol-phosphate dehydratase HisB [Cerasicoccus maritimus]